MKLIEIRIKLPDNAPQHESGSGYTYTRVSSTDAGGLITGERVSELNVSFSLSVNMDAKHFNMIIKRTLALNKATLTSVTMREVPVPLGSIDDRKLYISKSKEDELLDFLFTNKNT